MRIPYNDKFWQKINFETIGNFIRVNNHDISLKSVQDNYISKHQKKLSEFTIRKILKTHFNLKYTKVRQKYFFTKTLDFQKEKYIFLKILLKLMIQNFTVIFIDESNFNFR